MGWFDEQIKQRRKADDDSFSDALASMAGALTGHRVNDGVTSDAGRNIKNAVDEILCFYHVKSTELPAELTDLEEQLEYLLHPSGIMRRNVNLEGKWYRDAVGAFLGTLKTGATVALLPHKISGYTYHDYETGKTVKLNKKTAALLQTQAICFYKPLPLKKLSVKDLLIYIGGLQTVTDYCMVGAATLAVTLVGMLWPMLNSVLFSDIAGYGNVQMLVAFGAMMVAVTVAQALFGTVKSMMLERLQTKTTAAAEAALMMRVLSLPAQFFKQYSAGELSSRVRSVSNLCNLLYNVVLTTLFTSLFSLVYVTQVFHYAPALVVPALLITFVTVVFSLVSSLVQMKLSKRIMEVSAKESGLIYSFIMGIQKLKLAGAEKRAFARWAALYREKAALSYNPPAFIKLNSVIATCITMVGAVVLYRMAATSGVSVADYFAFNVAYGMVSGAFLSLSGLALQVADIDPILRMVQPILETVPEVSNYKKILSRIYGTIELCNVSFRYTSTTPLIVDNLSLKIKAGEYVALVGQTGCGKSTLQRLLLGFETPQKGSIYYDGEDISTVDLKSLRQLIGVVMQSGRLFTGDIFSNIVIAAPWLTLDDAWKAAELAGIAQDIRNLPMGMNTIISEGGGGISGGQRQRLMIARAIVAKPRILLLDEATSALDNLTQKIVVESLASLKCTRIVIAHRLSTIRQCDRILMLDGGRIIEEGNYDQLLQKNGHFAQLVKHQRLDDAVAL